jgi:putative ubiquitin-RnfH superfamily antitoxin RatB of RatAB toxin-antitoxin module
MVNLIQIEVVYATAEEQLIISLQVPLGTTAEQAIIASQLLARFPQIDLNRTKIGIFSQLCSFNTVLKAGDRVEIYRPLLRDPKEARRHRATER